MQTFQGKTTWYHVTNPTQEDVQFLTKEFSLPPETAEEIKLPSTRQKVHKESESLYAVIKFPLYDSKKRTSKAVEIDFLVNQTSIATVSYQKISPLDDIVKQCETLEGFRNNMTNAGSAAIIQTVLSALFAYGMRELSHIDHHISDATERVYAGKEKEMIRAISLIKRDVLDFRRILKPMEGILKELRDAYWELFAGSRKVQFENVLGAYHDLFDLTENHKDTIESLETTNQALLASRIGEVSQILAVAAFLLAPFTIIGTMFQINTQFTPIVGMPGDWWIILGIITAGCIALFVYFKKRGWF